MTITAKSKEALDIIKANGGEMETHAIMAALGVEKIASVTGRVNKLVNMNLAVRETRGEGEGKENWVVLTDAGMNFVPTEE